MRNWKQIANLAIGAVFALVWIWFLTLSVEPGRDELWRAQDIEMQQWMRKLALLVVTIAWFAAAAAWQRHYRHAKIVQLLPVIALVALLYAMR